VETSNIGNVDVYLIFNQSTGNNLAVGALIFGGNTNRTVSSMAAYVTQLGAVTGNFQMAILQPTSISQATVVAVTNVVTYDGSFRLTLWLAAMA